MLSNTAKPNRGGLALLACKLKIRKLRFVHIAKHQCKLYIYSNYSNISYMVFMSRSYLKPGGERSGISSVSSSWGMLTFTFTFPTMGSSSYPSWNKSYSPLIIQDRGIKNGSQPGPMIFSSSQAISRSYLWFHETSGESSNWWVFLTCFGRQILGAVPQERAIGLLGAYIDVQGMAKHLLQRCSTTSQTSFRWAVHKDIPRPNEDITSKLQMSLKEWLVNDILS